METFKAPHIFIELTLSDKQLAELDGVRPTQVPALSKTHPVMHSKHSNTLEETDKVFLAM